MTRIQNNITRITNKCYFNSYKIIFLHVNSHSHTEEVNVQYVSAWDIVTLFIWFWSEVLFAIFHFSWIALSSPPTGMGSGGSAGKEAGPLKALLRQQTQSALEQRVRQRQYIHMYLYIHDHKSWWFMRIMFLQSFALSLGFQGVSSSSEAFVRTGVCLEEGMPNVSGCRIFRLSCFPFSSLFENFVLEDLHLFYCPIDIIIKPMAH